MEQSQTPEKILSESFTITTKKILNLIKNGKKSINF